MHLYNNVAELRQFRGRQSEMLPIGTGALAVIPGRAKGASPESITTAWAYGFRARRFAARRNDGGEVRGNRPKRGSPAAAEHLNVEIADLLAQGVAVDAEQVGGADLVAAGGGERHREERMLDLA